MAKTSSVEKNKRRTKMSKRFSARRAKLKKLAMDKCAQNKGAGLQTVDDLRERMRRPGGRRE